MKNIFKLGISALTISLLFASCGSNNASSGSSEANSSDSVMMDTPMSTGTGSDTLQNSGGTEIDNQNQTGPRKKPNQ